MRRALAAVFLAGVAVEAAAGQAVTLTVSRGTERERTTKAQLERILHSYDLTRYTFTRQVVIEEGARNHAFPVLTLNARFADSGDDLLASYIHEQIHWHLRNHDTQRRRAVAELQLLYPAAPVGLPEGAETPHSTYGHLVTCYLELEALRSLLDR